METELSPSTDLTTSTLPTSKSVTAATAKPTSEKSLKPRKKGGSVAGTQALGAFEKASGGRYKIATRIASCALSLEQEAFVALLLDPARDNDNLATLAVDAGISPEDVLRLYQKGALAEANAIATSQLADALPMVTREVVNNAIETRVQCPCQKKGKPNPACQRCLGSGIWVREAKAKQQQMIWENAGLLKKSGGLTIQQNTAVGVQVGGSFMDKFVKSTDSVAYDVKPIDVKDAVVDEEPHGS